jgi:hypothetical protein
MRLDGRLSGRNISRGRISCKSLYVNIGRFAGWRLLAIVNDSVFINPLVNLLLRVNARTEKIPMPFLIDISFPTPMGGA